MNKMIFTEGRVSYGPCSCCYRYRQSGRYFRYVEAVRRSSEPLQQTGRGSYLFTPIPPKKPKPKNPTQKQSLKEPRELAIP